MSSESQDWSRTIAAWVQVALFIITIGGLAIAIGRRDAILDQHGSALSELKSITSDLVRTQLGMAANDQVTTQRIADLERRLAALETKQH